MRLRSGIACFFNTFSFKTGRYIVITLYNCALECAVRIMGSRTEWLLLNGMLQVFAYAVNIDFLSFRGKAHSLINAYKITGQQINEYKTRINKQNLGQ